MLKAAIKPAYSTASTWKPKLRLMATFLAGQGSVQLLSVLSGILLIRWLSVEEYARYSVTFAFQSTAQVLVELGFSGAVISLVGPRIYDKKVVGEYIRAGQHFRKRLFLLIGAGCAVAFPWLAFHHGWAVYQTAFLLIAILSNLYFSGYSAYYSSPLKMHKRLNDLYLVQLQSGLGRLAMLSILAFFAAVNAWIAALTTSLSVWLVGRTYKAKASGFIEEPQHASPAARRELFRYVRPVMPGIVYSAFSAQIALFIISIFGRSEGIAEVGALGRLGQLFLILNAASSTLIVPLIAKQPARMVRKKYLMVLGAVISFALAAAVAAFLFPEPLIWIIGSKYGHLEKEVGLLVLSSSINLVNVIMWDMNCSRKWLWSWIPVVSITSNVLLQVVLVMLMDLSTTYNVLIFSTIISVSNLLNKVLVGIIGFNKLKNEIDLLPA